MENTYIVCNLSIYSQRGYDEWRLIRQFSKVFVICIKAFQICLNSVTCAFRQLVQCRARFLSSWLYFMQYIVQFCKWLSSFQKSFYISKSMLLRAWLKMITRAGRGNPQFYRAVVSNFDIIMFISRCFLHCRKKNLSMYVIM